ncbi:MAG: OsmC family protein [Chloroflexi bacterium]|nr:OsmC family protein [Chloroflexota bacterium]
MKTTTVRWIEDMTFAAETGSGHAVVMDGKTGAGPSPMELLLVGMAGCTAVDVVSILKKQRQPLEGLEVRVEGRRADSHPKVYTHIAIEYIAHGDIDEKKLERAIALSQEKYCSASIMLGKTALIETRYRIQKTT